MCDCAGPQDTYQQHHFGQPQQQDPRSAPAQTMAPIDWSDSGVFRPSTFFPQQQQQEIPEAMAPPNLPQKPSQRPSANLQLQTSPEARSQPQRAPAESVAPIDWSAGGGPRVTEFVTSSHMERPSAMQYTQAGYSPESPPASRGHSPDPHEAAMPAPAADVPRPSAGSGYAFGAPGSAASGAPAPPSGHERSQSLVSADWSSGGLPRAASYAPVAAPRLSSIPEGGWSPHGAPGPRSPPSPQPPQQGYADEMPYVGGVVDGGTGGINRRAAQSMPPSQWGRGSAGPGGFNVAQAATGRSGAAASMYVGAPQQAGVHYCIDHDTQLRAGSSSGWPAGIVQIELQAD